MFDCPMAQLSDYFMVHGSIVPMFINRKWNIRQVVKEWPFITLNLFFKARSNAKYGSKT